MTEFELILASYLLHHTETIVYCICKHTLPNKSSKINTVLNFPTVRECYVIAIWSCISTYLKDIKRSNTSLRTKGGTSCDSSVELTLLEY